MLPFPFLFLGLCALRAMIALFYLSLFALCYAKSYCYLLQTCVHFSLPPHSGVPSILPSEGVCVTASYQTTLFFIFLPFSWRKDSLGCMPGSSGKMGKMRGGITEVEHTKVAAFATCIAWALYTLCYSSSHRN